MPRQIHHRAAIVATFLYLGAGHAMAAGPDLDGDGYISHYEFYRHIEFRHDARDRNGDGVVSWQELTGRFTGGDIPYSPEKALRFLNVFDLDRSGGVSSREMIHVISASGTFDRIDTNDDRRLSPSETRSISYLRPSSREGRVLLKGIVPD